jgi:hypothetical protein
MTDFTWGMVVGMALVVIGYAAANVVSRWRDDL